MKNSWLCLILAGIIAALLYFGHITSGMAFFSGIGLVLVSLVCNSIESVQDDIRKLITAVKQNKAS